MTSSIPATQESHCLYDTFCCPCNVIYSGIHWVCQKVKSLAEKFFGYFVRIGIFMFGEYQNGWLSRELIEACKKSPYDIRKRERFDPERLERSIEVLENLGGKRSSIKTIDGLATLDYMIITRADVNQKIQEHGGQWKEIPVKSFPDKGLFKQVGEAYADRFLNVILPPNLQSKEWTDFDQNVLSKMDWKRARIEIKGEQRDVWVTCEATDPNLRIDQKTRCFLRSHSPTQSWAMEKSYIGKHLNFGDVCVYDYRGTYKSRGRASEGGYALDIKTMYELLLLSYFAHQIWATGFCLGGAVAVTVKEEGHHEGVNFVGENTFTSAAAVLGNQAFPANWLVPLGINALKSTEEEICSKVKQDCFNTKAKFENLTDGPKTGFTVFFHTDTDTTLPENTVEELFRAARKSGKTFAITRHHPDRKKNGHGTDPFEDPLVWAKYVEILKLQPA